MAKKNRKSTKSKNTTKSKKSNNKVTISDNALAYILIVLGISLSIVISLPNVGIIGNGIKYFILILFSTFSYFILLSCICIGVYKLLNKDRVFIKNIHKIDTLIFFVMCIFIFVLFNIESMRQNANISFDSINNIVSLAFEKKGVGLIPYFLTFIFFKMIGSPGIVLFILFSFLYLLIKYKKDFVINTFNNANSYVKDKNTQMKNKKEEKIRLENLNKNQRMNSADNLIDEHFGDAKDIDYERKTEINLVTYDDQTDFEKYRGYDIPIDDSGLIRFSDDVRHPEDYSFENEINSDKLTYTFDNDEDKISFNEKIELLYNKYKKESKQEKNSEISLNDNKSIFEDKNNPSKDTMKLVVEKIDDEELSNDNEEIENNANDLYDTYESNVADEIADDEIAEKIVEEVNRDSSIQEDDEYYNDEYKAEDDEEIEDEEPYVPIVVKRPYVHPTIGLLNEYEQIAVYDRAEKIRKAQLLKQTLLSFGVEANVENISVGPTITRYEVKPKVGTKVSKITNLTEDLALALAAKSIRIEAPIPGKSYIGVEIPNETMQTVSFKETIKTGIDKKENYNIVFAMGKDISGEVVLSDITKMPHALIAGSTGSGKSVCINTIICSILYNYSPEEVKLILIDPKVVELSIYNKMPHLIIPVVTDMKKTPLALGWAVNEMEKRYALFAEHKSKDIVSYNQKMEEKLPRIVIIIDELADLMMVAPKEIEEAICRIAQKARACGIHLVVATQRPSVDVITGLIKANIPSRIAFAVSSQTDSRTILDSSGAEKLLGKGDMLYSPIGMNKPMRIQGAFLTEEEVEKITDFVQMNNPVDNLEEVQSAVSKEIDEIVISSDKKGNSDDELYDKVVEFAFENEEISVSLVQRQFRIGYNRASRIVEDMEKNGIVSKSDGSKPRKVIKSDM